MVCRWQGPGSQVSVTGQWDPKCTKQPLGCLSGARSAGAKAGWIHLISGMREARSRSPPSLCWGLRLLFGPHYSSQDSWCNSSKASETRPALGNTN